MLVTLFIEKGGTDETTRLKKEKIGCANMLKIILEKRVYQ